jgi:hypothetical protein
LLCKPSRDKGSRKPRAFYANQVVTRTHANQGHLCKPDRYIRKSEYELVRYSLGKEGKRNKARKRTKIGQRTRIVKTTGRLIKLHPPQYLTQAAVNQHPPPPSTHALSTSTHATGPQRSAHTRSLLGPHTARGPFSVLQPCESHVVLILAVIPGPPCLSTRCRSTHRPTPRSVAGPMPPL